MVITASKLRQNVYRLMDQTLQTGRPLEVRRKGKKLRIIPEAPPSKLSRLVKRNCLRGDPSQLVHLDWFKEWKHGLS